MTEDERKRKHTTFKDEDDDDDDEEGVKTKVKSEDKDKSNEGGEEKSKRKRKRKRKKKNTESNEGGGSGGGGDGNGSESNNMTSEDKFNSLDHTIYVEGIPFDCTEEEVKGFFVNYGCEDVIQMRLPRWQDSGRLRGYGHVVFDTTESQSKAIKELNGKNLRKRYLTIQGAKPAGSGGGGAGGRMSNNGGAPRAQPDDCRTIFVKNLPYNNITEEDVLHVFRSCGTIIEGGVRLARNYQTKQLKGFGYIEFKNPEGAYAAVQRAAKADGIKIGGRMCYVDYEESTMKGSFRTAEGKLWQKQHGSVHSNGNNGSNNYGRR